jgi:hypothetical protein
MTSIKAVETAGITSDKPIIQLKKGLWLIDKPTILISVESILKLKLKKSSGN